jgi:hypothetical protein
MVRPQAGKPPALDLSRNEWVRSGRARRKRESGDSGLTLLRHGMAPPARSAARRPAPAEAGQAVSLRRHETDTCPIQTRARTHSQPHRRTQTHAQTHAHTQAHTHAHARRHTHTHTHAAHTHTHGQAASTRSRLLWCSRSMAAQGTGGARRCAASTNTQTNTQANAQTQAHKQIMRGAAGALSTHTGVSSAHAKRERAM